MNAGRHVHVSERFVRLLDLYRKPDGSEWGGQDLENATGGKVTRSYVANLKKGRIENPGLAKLEAISKARDFPPVLWSGNDEKNDLAPDDALVATLRDDTMRAIIRETLRLGNKDKKLLLRMARQIASPPNDA